MQLKDIYGNVVKPTVECVIKRLNRWSFLVTDNDSKISIGKVESPIYESGFELILTQQTDKGVQFLYGGEWSSDSAKMVAMFFEFCIRAVCASGVDEKNNFPKV